MRAVVQRVTNAKVEVAKKVVGEIDRGILVFVGVGKDDTRKDLLWMTEKIPNLRIFEDQNGKMNRSVVDVNGGILVVSQFTLYGDCRRGKRPSFSDAASPEIAKKLYEEFCDILSKNYPNLKISRGIFQADMKVILTNDGPVTLLLDSQKLF